MTTKFLKTTTSPAGATHQQRQPTTTQGGLEMSPVSGSGRKAQTNSRYVFLRCATQIQIAKTSNKSAFDLQKSCQVDLWLNSLRFQHIFCW